MNLNVILSIIGVIVWLLVNFSKSDLYYGIKGIVILVFVFFMYKSSFWGYSIMEPIKYLILFFSPSLLILLIKLTRTVIEKINSIITTKKIIRELEERNDY